MNQDQKDLVAASPVAPAASAAEKPLSPLLEAIKRPIPGTNPCGQDVTYDDDFQKIKAEFNREVSTKIDYGKATDDAKELLKLTVEKRRELEKKKEAIESKSLTSDAGSKNYALIIELATKILSEKSKDLTVASYLCIALTREEQFSGLAEGLAAVNILVQTFWEGLYPAKHRMAMRQNTFTDFLMPRVSDLIAPKDENGERRTVQVSADDGEPLAAAMKNLGELQKHINANMPQESQSAVAVLVKAVKECFEKALKFRPGPTIIKPPDDEKPLEAAMKSLDELQKYVNASMPQENQSAVVVLVNVVKEDFEKALKSASGPTIPPPIPEINSEQSAFDSMRKAVGYWRNGDRTSVRPYRLARSGRWDALSTEPPNQKIPAPRVERRNYFNALLQKAEWNKLLDEGEANFTEAPFHLWLDLQRLIVAAMDGLGPSFQNARLAILQDLALLLQRLPKLPNLTFSDGSRFAEAATQSWIEETVMPVLGSGEAANTGAVLASANGELTGQFEEAKKIFNRGDIAGAITYLQQGATLDNSGKARFLRRLYTATLCIRGNLYKPARPLLEELHHEIDKFALDSWEPPLALEVWKNLHQCYEALAATATPASKLNLLQNAENIFEKICRLDVGYALAASGMKPQSKPPAPPKNNAEKSPAAPAEKIEAEATTTAAESVNA